MIKITCINNNIIYNLSTGEAGGGVGLLSHIFLVWENTCPVSKVYLQQIKPNLINIHWIALLP